MAVDPQELHIQTLPRDTAKLTRKGHPDQSHVVCTG